MIHDEYAIIGDVDFTSIVEGPEVGSEAKLTNDGLDNQQYQMMIQKRQTVVYVHAICMIVAWTLLPQIG